MPSTTDSTGLGRLLDRAAGALGHTHPALAAELTARATLAHEPPDPFDGLTGDAVDRYRTFGYLVLPGFFDHDLVATLRHEVRATLRAVHGEDRLRRPPPGGGMAVHEACLLGPWAPPHGGPRRRPPAGRPGRAPGRRRGASLARRHPGQAVLGARPAQRHRDPGAGVKLVAYLEPLDGATGALRGPARQPPPPRRRSGPPVLARRRDPRHPGPGPGHGARRRRSVRPAAVARHMGRSRPPPVEHPLCPGRHHPPLAGRPGRVVRRWHRGPGQPAGGLPPLRPPLGRRGRHGRRPRFDQRHRWMFRFHRLGVLDAYGATASFT